MRDISIIQGQYFKHSDTATPIVLRLIDGGLQTVAPSVDNASIRLKDSKGISVGQLPIDSINDDGDLVLSSKDLDKLGPGLYQIEVKLKEIDGTTAIYPSEDNPSISIIADTDDDSKGTDTVVSLDLLQSQVNNLYDRLSKLPEEIKFSNNKVNLVSSSEPASVDISENGDGTFAVNLTIPAVFTGKDDGTVAIPGKSGKSSYQEWLDAGNSGSVQDFLNSLKGPKGDKGDKGDPGEPGKDGKSDYQEWLDEGHEGSEEDFLASLKGPKGDPGPAGKDGKSAYEIAVSNGFKGTESEWIQSLKASSVRHAPTGYTLDRTTNPWTIWFDNGSGIQFPAYGTTPTVYGYNQAINEYSNGWITWPLISSILSASHGTLTLDTLAKVNGSADYWDVAKVINPINSDADSYGWSNVYFNDTSRSNSKDFRSNRQKNFLKACYELGIFSAEDLKPFGLVKVV